MRLAPVADGGQNVDGGDELYQAEDVPQPLSPRNQGGQAHRQSSGSVSSLRSLRSRMRLEEDRSAGSSSLQSGRFRQQGTPPIGEEAEMPLEDNRSRLGKASIQNVAKSGTPESSISGGSRRQREAQGSGQPRKGSLRSQQAPSDRDSSLSHHSVKTKETGMAAPSTEGDRGVHLPMQQRPDSSESAPCAGQGGEQDLAPWMAEEDDDSPCSMHPMNCDTLYRSLKIDLNRVADDLMDVIVSVEAKQEEILKLCKFVSDRMESTTPLPGDVGGRHGNKRLSLGIKGLSDLRGQLGKDFRDSNGSNETNPFRKRLARSMTTNAGSKKEGQSEPFFSQLGPQPAADGLSQRQLGAKNPDRFMSGQSTVEHREREPQYEKPVALKAQNMGFTFMDQGAGVRTMADLDVLCLDGIIAAAADVSMASMAVDGGRHGNGEDIENSSHSNPAEVKRKWPWNRKKTLRAQQVAPQLVAPVPEEYSFSRTPTTGKSQRKSVAGMPAAKSSTPPKGSTPTGEDSTASVLFFAEANGTPDGRGKDPSMDTTPTGRTTSGDGSVPVGTLNNRPAGLADISVMSMKRTTSGSSQRELTPENSVCRNDSYKERPHSYDKSPKNKQKPATTGRGGGDVSPRGEPSTPRGMYARRPSFDQLVCASADLAICADVMSGAAGEETQSQHRVTFNSDCKEKANRAHTLSMDNLPDEEVDEAASSAFSDVSNGQDQVGREWKRNQTAETVSCTAGRRMSASMTALRHLREQELVQNTLNETMTEQRSAAESRAVYMIAIPTGILSLFGIIPMSMLSRKAATCYERFFLCLVVLVCVLTGAKTLNETEDAYLSMADTMFALGGLVGLVSSRLQSLSRLLGPDMRTLELFAAKYGFIDAWLKDSLLSCAFACVLALAAMAINFTVMLGTDEGQAGGTLLRSAPLVFFANALSCMLCYSVLHICSALKLTVDGFFMRFFEEKDFCRGIAEWNAVQAILRRAAHAIDGCLVSMGTSVAGSMMLTCASILSAKQAGDVQQVQQRMWRLISWLPQVMLILFCLFKAAAVTEHCLRAPALVNSLIVDQEDTINPERQYMVTYIEQSAAGFYVQGVRLTAFMVLKCTYLLVVVTFSFVAQTQSG
eukprot:TRINITY_DN100677_c0_g1_i1.p1 TRINITY_DN100677_c0_g1~~TRINITY_DN100677_c0_g1_i1.p1  ORF type:complete len:1197 (+),score=182.03 TRINITY_DN100677_c0_g1_i1:245-3592(+)